MTHRVRFRLCRPLPTSEAGSAIVLTLVVIGCVLTAAAGLLSVATGDHRMAANFQTGTRTRYAAESIAAYAVAALARPGGWDAALAGGRAPFAETTTQVQTSWSTALDLAAETAMLQQQANARWGAGPDTPIWQLFASGSLHELLQMEPEFGSPYVAAWIADNVDGDANPLEDSDGILVVRAEARLGQRVRRVEVFVRRGAQNTFVSTSTSVAAVASADAASTGLAQDLPIQPDDAAAGEEGVRIVSWREVP
jgi:hypothetical protein